MGTMIQVEGADDVRAYLAEPAEDVALRGGLVVIHEIWGLVDHIRDVADRFAAEGWVVLAPDLMGGTGISPHLVDELRLAYQSPDQAVRTAVQPRLREALAPINAPGFAEQAIASLRAVVGTLLEQPGVGDSVAVTGFCFGGSYAFALAGADPRVHAAVPFYGAPPAVTDLSRIRVPVLAFYGDEDARLVDGLPELTERMRAADVDFTAQVYPHVGHAFFNDTNPHAYDEEAAEDAWNRTLEFLGPIDERAAARA